MFFVTPPIKSPVWFKRKSISTTCNNQQKQLDIKSYFKLKQVVSNLSLDFSHGFHRSIYGTVANHVCDSRRTFSKGRVLEWRIVVPSRRVILQLYTDELRQAKGVWPAIPAQLPQAKSIKKKKHVHRLELAHCSYWKSIGANKLSTGLISQRPSVNFPQGYIIMKYLLIPHPLPVKESLNFELNIKKLFRGSFFLLRST